MVGRGIEIPRIWRDLEGWQIIFGDLYKDTMEGNQI
jgi:hypothetical protein